MSWSDLNEKRYMHVAWAQYFIVITYISNPLDIIICAACGLTHRCTFICDRLAISVSIVRAIASTTSISVRCFAFGVAAATAGDCPAASREDALAEVVVALAVRFFDTSLIFIDVGRGLSIDRVGVCCDAAGVERPEFGGELPPPRWNGGEFRGETTMPLALPPTRSRDSAGIGEVRFFARGVAADVEREL